VATRRFQQAHLDHALSIGVVQLVEYVWHGGDDGRDYSRHSTDALCRSTLLDPNVVQLRPSQRSRLVD
jgi:hypothetical protein